MPLTGTNRKCAKCCGKCKQWSEVTVIACRKFKPSGHQAQQNAQEAQGK